MKKTLHKPIVIIGSGMAGLAAAIRLSASGHSVTLLEKEAAPGGKMRHVHAGGLALDAGPTVLTMKWVFDELLAYAATDLASEVPLRKSNVLARHFWGDGTGLDLFADPLRTAEAIAGFSNAANADGYLRFCEDSKRIFETLQRSYIAAPRPGPFELGRRIGLGRPDKLLGLKPFSTLWSALGNYFPDERLRQLFGRYATYCGSSPFQAPATLMLVAHVEQAGVWLVDANRSGAEPVGGMHMLAKSLLAVARRHGAQILFNQTVERIETQAGRISGVVTNHGTLAADRVIFNGDVSALPDLVSAWGGPVKVPVAERSLSALVTCMHARASGRELAHHTVFFGDDYKGEFDAIFRRQEAPADPTVYVCAQDRADDGTLRSSAEGERLYMLMNMPAIGDRSHLGEAQKQALLERCLERLEKSGLGLAPVSSEISMTGPNEFEALFPGSGGALYGRASHGWMASFKRQGSRTKVPGLYLAGGSVHPGPGVPMAALSGQLAAEELLSDLALT